MKTLFKRYEDLPRQVRASMWFLICSFIQKGISAISTPIFTRLLSAAEYGEFNGFLSWESILRVVLSLNLFYGIYTAGLVKFQERREEFVSALQGLTATLILFWLVTYYLFHAFFNELFSLTTAQMVCLIGQVWTTAIFSFWAAEQRVEYRYRELVLVTLLVSISKPVIGVLLVTHVSDKVTARIFGLFLVELIGYGWMFIFHFKRCSKLFSKFFWKYALRFNIPLIPHYLAQNVLSSSDRIMIIRMVSNEKAGIYSVAYSISLIMNIFNTALTQTTSPWVYQRIKMRKEEDISSIMMPTIGLIAGVNLLLIFLAPEIVRIFAPKEYYEAIWTIPPVVMSVYFIFLYNVYSFYEFYFEKTGYIASATITAAILNIILNLICIRIFGYIAAGYTTLFCYAVYAAGHYFAMKKIALDSLDGHEIVPLRHIIILTVAFMTVGFAVSGLYNYPIARYMVLSVFFILLLGFRKRLLRFVKTLITARKMSK